MDCYMLEFLLCKLFNALIQRRDAMKRCIVEMRSFDKEMCLEHMHPFEKVSLSPINRMSYLTFRLLEIQKNT